MIMSKERSRATQMTKADTDHPANFSSVVSNLGKDNVFMSNFIQQPSRVYSPTYVDRQRHTTIQIDQVHYGSSVKQESDFFEANSSVQDD